MVSVEELLALAVSTAALDAVAVDGWLWRARDYPSHLGSCFNSVESRP
jgi:hypothetical protein